MRTIVYYWRLALLTAAASLIVSACDSDANGPELQRGAVAEVELNGTRPELYLQDLSGAGRQRIHFNGATDPFPQNSPLVPPFTDENLRALGSLRWSVNGQRIALVATSPSINPKS